MHTTLGEQIYYQYDDPSDPYCETKAAVRRFKIEEHEMVALLHMGIQIEAAFGPGWVAIEWKNGQPIPEAVRQVLRMRGVLEQGMHGAGI
jgi:hypothetical protein